MSNGTPNINDIWTPRKHTAPIVNEHGNTAADQLWLDRRRADRDFAFIRSAAAHALGGAMSASPSVSHDYAARQALSAARSLLKLISNEETLITESFDRREAEIERNNQ